jgi:tetrachloro-p-hydroquinone reductive dehalogenase
MELHYYPSSHWSRVITLCLAEHGLAFERRLVDITRNATFAPEYIRLNPRGVVPTLVDDGQVVWDGRKIAEYLDTKTGHDLCCEGDPEVQAWTRRLHDFPLMLFSYSVWVLGHRGEKSADILDDKVQRARQHAEAYPDLAEHYTRKAEFFAGFRSRVYDAAHVAAEMQAGTKVLDELGEWLLSRTWIGGDDYSFADAIATSILYRLVDLGKLDHWLGDDGHGLHGYFERLKARPSYRAVFHDDPLLSTDAGS